MNFLFFCSVAVVTSRTLKPTEIGDLGLKLRKLDQYQAATGIDDAKRDEIWNTTMANCMYKNKIIKSTRTAKLAGPIQRYRNFGAYNFGSASDEF